MEPRPPLSEEGDSVSYATGQPVLLSSLVKDAAGAPGNATTVTLTIDKPDGSTATPAVANPPATTGDYQYVYVPTLAGLHGVRWLFGGTNASAPLPDSFYVEPGNAVPLISLAEARKQCRLASPADDPEVQRFALIASDIAERHTGVWRRTPFTTVFDGGGEFLRLRAPVLAVTSVTEDGVALTSAAWVLDASRGWLYRGISQARQCWSYGVQNVNVQYVAGNPQNIPDGVRQGIRVQVQHLWDSQRGGSGLPRQSGAMMTIDPRTGFTIPNAVLELWRPHFPSLVA
jgi:hypothetical protein